MKRWSFLMLGIIWSAQSQAFMGNFMSDMNFLYLPSEFVVQRTDYCRIYFPDQSSIYQAAQKDWLAQNGKKESALQETLRNSDCKSGGCEGGAVSEAYRADILKKRALKSLKLDMLKLAKASEKEAAELCKETLELLGDTLNLAELTKVFRRDEK